MSLIVNSIGDNPFQPGIIAETYIPDQLIAGDAKIVSDDGAVLTGGAKLPRGTILGQILDASATTTAGTAAKGTFTFSGQPAVADTVTLNGTAVAFIANDTAPVGNQVPLGLDEAQTIENLLAFLQASTDTQIAKFTYTATGQVITATALTGGTGGNSLTIAESSAAIAVSGATLTGGVANTGNGTFGAITFGPGVKQGSYRLVATQATTGTPAASSQPAEGNVGTGVMGTVTPGAAAMLGEYQVVLTATGATAAFDLIGPNGQVLGAGNVATAYNANGLGFTLANGGTMTKGDTWDIFVTDNGVATFSVTDPAGNARPAVTVGTAYADQLAFTLSQGATKFVVGDAFTVTVGPGNGKYVQCVATANDGSQVPCGVLADVADATAGDVACGVYVAGEFNENRIWFDPSWSVASLKVALRRTPIFLKNSIQAIDPT